MLLSGLSLRDLAAETYHEFNDDDVLTYAAALGFHLLLALFPFLLLLLAVVTFLHVPQAFSRLMEWSRTFLPPQSARQVDAVIREFHDSRRSGLLSVGIVGVIWAASGGVRAAIGALNKAYDVTETRSILRRYVVSVLFTFAGGAIVLICIALLIVGPELARFLAAQIGLGEVFVVTWTWLRYVAVALMLTMVCAIMYSALPNVRGFRWFSVGAVLCVLCWLLLSVGFRVYLSHFGSYNALYGSLGAVIILLLYLWFCSIALLTGGEINAVLHRAARKTDAQLENTGGAC